MAKKKQTDEEILIDKTAELQRDFDRWENLHQNGGSDPFWSDGVNLNLVRNHIIGDKRILLEHCEQSGLSLPDIYAKATPEELPYDFYAKDEEIKSKAKAIIEKVEATYKMEEYDQDSNFVRYFNGYKKALKENDLAYVRRYTFERLTENESAARAADKPKQLAFDISKTVGVKQPPKPASNEKQKNMLFEVYNTGLNAVKCNWLSFLDCSADFYKHSFVNQVMIFSQDKTATLAADERAWRKVGRYPEFNAKCIITIIQKNGSIAMERLYDISNTYGDDITVNADRFKLEKLSDSEAELLDRSLADKYKLEHGKAMNKAVQAMVAATYKDVSENLKPLEPIIKNSIYYCVCHKLGIYPKVSLEKYFAKIQELDVKLIAEMGKSVGKASKQLLDEIESQINKIRSAKQHEGNSYNQQRTIRGNREEFAQELKQRDNLQTGIERNLTNTDIIPADRSGSDGGQLSFGTLRQGNNEVHGGKSQRPLERADVGRLLDEKAAPKGIRPNGSENIADGTDREEKPTSKDGQLYGNSTAHELDSSAGGGTGERGIVQSDLSVTADSAVTVVANNFCYVDTDIDYGGPKVKYRANVTAIRLLNDLEGQNRFATTEEQLTLSKYTGFGGIPKVFDEAAEDWREEYSELKDLLTEGEYVSARASTKTAFYTPPYVIREMYNGLISLGMTDESPVLDPACGTGNFFGALPPSLQGCKLHGTELDELTGKIAKQLYQAANIEIKGYQDTNYPDNLFHFAVGNVPFGDYRIFDERYNKFKFPIHEYFFAKTLDKLKPNGVMAFITSSWTMDKKTSTFRKYLAERAELIGAVRLPDTAFKGIAGTEVTSDILFLQKRDRAVVCEPEWVHLGLTDNDMPINQYYIDNPQNLLGNMIWSTSQFGRSTTLQAFDNADLKSLLSEAVQGFTRGRNLKLAFEQAKAEATETLDVIPADPNVKNFTFTILNDNLYFRENGEMLLRSQSAGMSDKSEKRIRRLHGIRTALREIISLQGQDYAEDEFQEKLISLNSAYDDFVKKYGYISDKINKRAFIEDSDLPLLLSIEEKDSSGDIKKTKVFTEPTIRPPQSFTPKSYEDLVTLSMTQQGYVDIPYMAKAFEVEPYEVINRLQGKIFLNPAAVGDMFHNELFEYIELMRNRDLDVDEKKVWKYIAGETADVHCFEQADEYLTGNVKQKLDYAQIMAERFPEVYTNNVTALKHAQPEPLTVDQINFKLGSSWIDLKHIREFIAELGQIPFYLKQIDDREDKNRICLAYNKFIGTYTIYNKSLVKTVQTTSAFGTERKSLFAIIEDCLNLKECRVYDTVPCITRSGNDSTKSVLNVKETQAARQKQELIKNEFKNWLCADPSRASDIVKSYNNKFNVYKVRQFDGSHLTYEGMTADIKLRKHQNDAVARCLYSGQNVLLGHVVGAGKTYTMVAAASELKRTGISNKPLIVVPNHLTEQWGEDWLKLYPAANILVATKKDFEPENRRRFVGKICTGDFDAIIIGHTQFEKIPMSAEYVSVELKGQILEISQALSEMQNDEGVKRFTIKQLEKEKERLKTRLLELSSDTRKDSLLTFEETGIDRLFIDEAHYYKNCYVNTKLSNVAGISTTSAQKSFDMLMKTKYISGKNEGQGVVFATGTPISNSITEMFVLQRYLQPQALNDAGLSYFDDWISTFGETKMVLELKPEGTGFRMRTRVTRFHNLPELMTMFSQVADIKVAEDLNLPVPALKTGKPIICVSKPSDYVTQYIRRLADRADAIRNGDVDPSEDNMLKVTNEGRAIAIDVRLIDRNAPVSPDSKIYQCCDNVKSFYDEGNADKAAQLIFLDTGVWIYELIKEQLISLDIPAEEIAFIGDAKTEEQKALLFADVRNGNIRVLLGSTQKMGAGTNVQERLIAKHDLDCPWRPSDIEQRDGRIVRQGNVFDEVSVCRYITESTFDAYLWGIQENKQTFISQIMTNKSILRSCDDIDDAVLDCAEVKMLATGDPTIKEKMQLDNDIYMLQNEKSAFIKQRVRLHGIVTDGPQLIEKCEVKIKALEHDIKITNENAAADFVMKVGGTSFDKRVEAGEALTKLLNGTRGGVEAVLGEYKGLTISTKKERDFNGIHVYLKGEYVSTIYSGSSDLGFIKRLENTCDSLQGILETAKEDMTMAQKELIAAEAELQKPFTKEAELREKLERQVSLNSTMESESGVGQIVDESASADESKQSVSEMAKPDIESPNSSTLDERINSARAKSASDKIQNSTNKAVPSMRQELEEDEEFDYER